MAGRCKRMIMDLPRHVQMAIRLRAVKNRCTTGEVVTEAVKKAFPEDYEEATKAFAEHASVAPEKAHIS